MALQKSRFSQVPQDAVILTEEQALLYYTKILNNWPKTSDVLGYKYGCGVLAAASIMSGIYMNSFFRGRFRLLNYGFMSSYLPISAVPATISMLSHQQFVLSPLILNIDGCPICLETRASVLQALSGCIMPLVLAPITSLALVHRYHTYDMPYITKEPRKVFQIVAKMYKQLKGVAWGIFLGQAVIGGLVTYFEAKSIINVNLELVKTERENEFLS
ncbi:uncharacterized protein LOC130446588 [Diorhabda sublineata]|uniref:uncharacterized protein LOC130446588 n=1 Tax=Diorhabda sublineata TaxID=1163346 RepID=UPI0024E1925A|nr:uncharacterized protein LOC130446588 [Diorhabda sublineata]